jgi:rhamnogalacturonyl hydrolase YesR
MVRGFATYQDPASGRWFQVVNKGDRSDNWTETSCSSVYTYTIDKAVEKGYVAAPRVRLGLRRRPGMCDHDRRAIRGS